jgi:hypothetical protein
VGLIALRIERDLPRFEAAKVIVAAAAAPIEEEYSCRPLRMRVAPAAAPTARVLGCAIWLLRSRGAVLRAQPKFSYFRGTSTTVKKTAHSASYI